METFYGGRLIVKTGDITREETDAIVNAANSSLLGGGGVDGAIHRAGGPEIIGECRRIRDTEYPDGLPAGEAVVTTGGRLPAKWVIHTVGPVWHGGGRNEGDLLANAYRNSLKRADEKNCLSAAFPAISTGVYGFPRERAARIVADVMKSYIDSGGGVRKIVLVFFGDDDYRVFLESSGLQSP
ncbi:MAG: O-acetyl-ADP-ribose deacetylase [Brevinematales bacterium]|nr:O-acetyl-ADP-ribose deacetylase [Brevinematales bacterium]